MLTQLRTGHSHGTTHIKSQSRIDHLLPVAFFNPNLNPFVLQNEKIFGKDRWIFSSEVFTEEGLRNLELLIDEP